VTKPDPLPASARANRPYGSGVRGIQLFFSSPLVALQKEFGSTKFARKRKGELLRLCATTPRN